MSDVDKVYYNPYKIKAAVGPYSESQQEIDTKTGRTNNISVSKGTSASIDLQGTILIPALSHLLTGELRYNVYRGKGSDKLTAFFANAHYLFPLNKSKEIFFGPDIDVRRLSSSEPQAGLGARIWIVPTLNLKLTRWLTPNKEINAELGCITDFIRNNKGDKVMDPLEFKFVFSQIYNQETKEYETIISVEFKLSSIFKGWGPWVDTDSSWKSAMRFGVAKTAFKEFPKKSEGKK